ncbi:MFS transporter [Chloroflexota bacterium]
MQLSTEQQYRSWRRRILISVWISYAMFYVGRVNMSIAIPGIMDEYGYTKTVMGGILTALFVAYAFGQFVNGQLGDKFGGRIMISLGLLLSGIFNFLFGFSTILTVMIIIWALNGYVQSMGWSPSVKTVANWFPRAMRGRVGGILGSSYQIGNVLSWLLAGLLAGSMGWRWIFWVPAMVLGAAAIHWYVRGRNAPEIVGLPCLEEEEDCKERGEATSDHHLGFKYTLKLVLASPQIWCLSFALFFLNVVRYGFMNWAPTYMFEVQGATISTAAYKAIAIPLAGSLGAIFAGWMSDRLFGLRRAPASAIMLFALALFVWIYPQIPSGNWTASLAVLIMIGFLTYGPHVAIVSYAPMDFGSRKAAASVAGFVDGMGYIGAAITGIASGFLADQFGWNAAFYLWMAGALGAAFLMLMLWNYRPKITEYH